MRYNATTQCRYVISAPRPSLALLCRQFFVEYSGSGVVSFFSSAPSRFLSMPLTVSNQRAGNDDPGRLTLEPKGGGRVKREVRRVREVGEEKRGKVERKRREILWTRGVR
jgi:hypothetical protein